MLETDSTIENEVIELSELKKENPDYNYLRELFRHIRKNLNIEVESGKERKLPYVPT